MAPSSGSRATSANRPISSVPITSDSIKPTCYTNASWQSERWWRRQPGLRFFFVRTLKRRFPPDSIPYPRYTHHRVPQVLSPEEVARLIDAASNLQARAILMTLYSTGVRRSELVRLRVQDIDSERMVIHIRKGKGGKDRDLPLCTKLLETLREYWRWKKPKAYLFPSSSGHRGVEQPMSGHAIWYACAEAARHAGLKKRVAPHMLRHYTASPTMPL